MKTIPQTKMYRTFVEKKNKIKETMNKKTDAFFESRFWDVSKKVTVGIGYGVATVAAVVILNGAIASDAYSATKKAKQAKNKPVPEKIVTSRGNTKIRTIAGSDSLMVNDTLYAPLTEANQYLLDQGADSITVNNKPFATANPASTTISGDNPTETAQDDSIPASNNTTPNTSNNQVSGKNLNRNIQVYEFPKNTATRSVTVTDTSKAFVSTATDTMDVDSYINQVDSTEAQTELREKNAKALNLEKTGLRPRGKKNEIAFVYENISVDNKQPISGPGVDAKIWVENISISGSVRQMHEKNSDGSFIGKTINPWTVSGDYVFMKPKAVNLNAGKIGITGSGSVNSGYRITTVGASVVIPVEGATLTLGEKMDLNSQKSNASAVGLGYQINSGLTATNLSVTYTYGNTSDEMENMGQPKAREDLIIVGNFRMSTIASRRANLGLEAKTSALYFGDYIQTGLYFDPVENLSVGLFYMKNGYSVEAGNGLNSSVQFKFQARF